MNLDDVLSFMGAPDLFDRKVEWTDEAKILNSRCSVCSYEYDSRNGRNTPTSSYCRNCGDIYDNCMQPPHIYQIRNLSGDVVSNIIGYSGFCAYMRVNKTYPNVYTSDHPSWFEFLQRWWSDPINQATAFKYGWQYND